MSQNDYGLPPGYRIRSAGPRDVEQACAIARQAWKPIHASFRAIMGPEMHTSLCPNWAEDKAAQVRSHAERHPDQMLVVEQEDDGGIVAFLTFRIEVEKEVGTIGNNAVSPDAQGRGVGSAMYRCALDVFRQRGMKYARVTTGLDPGHAPARSAYEKAGFDIAREDITYYKYL